MSNFINFINFIERAIHNETLNASLNQEASSQPTDTEFIDKLETFKLCKNDLSKNLSCAICQENFKVGEKVMKLPCKNGPHYFHCEMNKDICEGILPWLKNNNTCPICRHEFPKSINEENREENSTDNQQSQQENNRETQVNLMESFVRLQHPHFIVSPHANIITLPLPINLFQRRETIVNQEYDSDLQEAIRRSLDEQ